MVVVAACRQARPDDGVCPCLDDCFNRPAAVVAWNDWCDPGIEILGAPPGPQFWTIDYRVQQMFNSHTSYQFGSQPEFSPNTLP